MKEHEWHTGDNLYLADLMSFADWTLERESFFSAALLPYYEAGVYYWDGLKRETGDIIYRLSDLVDVEDRIFFAIFPSKKGSITVKLGEPGDPHDSQWDSLEDWREEWAKNHPNIPSHQVVQDFIKDYIHKPLQNS